LKEPVRLVVDVKKDADPNVVLNQLFQFTPLQDSFSINLLALVDGKPRLFTFKELIEEFIRHRITVIRRRTQFLLAKARKRRHTVEGLIIAHADIDEVIRTIRTSSTQAEAKQRLMTIQCPSAMLQRALGEGFADFQLDRGVKENYTLTPVQADAILRMTLGHLVNLEQEKLGDEHRNLMAEIGEFMKILADETLIRNIIREDLLQIKAKHGDKRRTEISGDSATDIDIEDLIEEEAVVVSLTQGGYIKRSPITAYRAQKRGGKGVIGAKVVDDDPVQHLFVTSTHNYLMFFTNLGKVHWHKVYGIPDLDRTSKGRSIVNLLNLAPEEKIQDCLAVADFDTPDRYLVLATKNGLVKKTALSAYRRPKQGGLIAVKLREGDELIDATVVGIGDELIVSSAQGNAVRFRHTDVRAAGRNTSGVRGMKFRKGDYAIGMVVATPDWTLLTVCENGYGKRTPIGPNGTVEAEQTPEEDEETADGRRQEAAEDLAGTPVATTPAPDDVDDADEERGTLRYTTKRRGGLGLKDIKTSARNGSVIGICRVRDEDELMMITAKGQIQRIKAADVRVMGRNTQGVRLMNLDEGDTLVAVKRIPKIDGAADNIGAEEESEPEA
jgi:DNA gyrase subunit A